MLRAHGTASADLFLIRVRGAMTGPIKRDLILLRLGPLGDTANIVDNPYRSSPGDGLFPGFTREEQTYVLFSVGRTHEEWDLVGFTHQYPAPEKMSLVLDYFVEMLGHLAALFFVEQASIDIRPWGERISVKDG